VSRLVSAMPQISSAARATLAAVSEAVIFRLRSDDMSRALDVTRHVERVRRAALAASRPRAASSCSPARRAAAHRRVTSGFAGRRRAVRVRLRGGSVAPMPTQVALSRSVCACTPAPRPITENGTGRSSRVATVRENGSRGCQVRAGHRVQWKVGSR